MNGLRQYFNFKEVKHTFALLLPFVMRYKKAYSALLFLLGMDVVLTISFAWFFGDITEAAVGGDFPRLKSMIGIGVLLIFLSISTTVLNIYFETVATNGVKKDFKNYLFHHILRLPEKETSYHHSGELVSYLTNDIHSLSGVIGNRLISLIRIPITYITVFIYLFHINRTLSLLCLVIAPAAMLVALFFGYLLRKNSKEMLTLLSGMNTLLNEAFHGLTVIRSFTLQKLIYKRYQKQNQKLFDLEKKSAKLQGWFYTGGQLASTIAFFLCLILGAFYVSKGVMAVGALLTFMNLVDHLVFPLKDLASEWAGFQRSVVAVERLSEVLKRPTEARGLSSYKPLKELKPSVEFRNMTFSYNENQKLFEDFSLKVPAGKVIALVGPSGAGKSSLFNLLQSFYKPRSGDILINNESIENLTVSRLRSAIALVPQESFLFGGTIRENLIIARPGITEEQIIKAAIGANIHDFIMSLPEGYDSQIGERGLRLSGGQKQRIAIARALLKDAPILLLDEATSALDSETEFKVQQALEHLMEGRTTLIIAHRLSTIQNADIIVVMKDGSIVQQGTHQELIHQQGLYQQLHRTYETEKSNLEIV